MARNMKEQNRLFFNNICSSLDEDLARQVSNAVRFIFTNDVDKEWLKNLVIKHFHRLSKNSYAILLLLDTEEYLCLVNINVYRGSLPDRLIEINVNAGLITVLGANGFLTSKMGRSHQLELYDKVLYETTDDYQGHQWKDIENYFPAVYCYKVDLEDLDVEIRENLNSFYWILCQVVMEFDIGNNPFTIVSKDAWEKVIYEGDFSKIKYKNLLLAYTALSWDITYLYLYQCLEDKFACESVRTLHEKLDLGMTEQALSQILYDELSWQPKDIEGIERIIKRCSPQSNAKSMLNNISGGQSLPKFIYSMRNRIVHETREPPFLLDDNISWEKAITGLLFLLVET